MVKDAESQWFQVFVSIGNAFSEKLVSFGINLLWMSLPSWNSSDFNRCSFRSDNAMYCCNRRQLNGGRFLPELGTLNK